MEHLYKCGLASESESLVLSQLVNLNTSAQYFEIYIKGQWGSLWFSSWLGYIHNCSLWASILNRNLVKWDANKSGWGYWWFCCMGACRTPAGPVQTEDFCLIGNFAHLKFSFCSSWKQNLAFPLLRTKQSFYIREIRFYFRLMCSWRISKWEISKCRIFLCGFSFVCGVFMIHSKEAQHATK